MKKLLLAITITCFAAQLSAQNTQPWNGKKCAVVLTYDDALNTHLDNVIPLLDSLGLKGTFYLSASFPGCKNRLEGWKKAAAKGHIPAGSHFLSHNKQRRVRRMGIVMRESPDLWLLSIYGSEMAQSPDARVACAKHL